MLQSPDEMVRLLQRARLGPAGAGPNATTLQAATILESEAGSRFDDFSFLAARTLRAPVAGISLIDGPHHWIRSAEGFGLSPRRRTDPFCRALMREPDQILLVADAASDAAMSESSLVTSAPFIRAYAGAALRDSAGRFLGTIFVGDNSPRLFSTDDVAALKTLAVGLETVLALHGSVVELFKAVTCDYLTGLLNRAAFELKLGEAVRGAASGSSAALICLDVDQFKAINDRFGHAVGDAVLVETAARLERSLRRSDCVARLSGDEFAVLMSCPATEDDAAALANRILIAFEPPFTVGDSSIGVRVSFGVALLPDDAQDAAEIVRRADVALYDAKRRGGSCCSLYDRAFEIVLLERTTLRADLQAAIDRNEFHLAWQPIVASDGGVLRGYEVLLRWDRPRHGPVPPADFVPFAEETGQIVAIDTWVLHNACTAAASLDGDLLVAVNVWPGWFGRGTLGGVIRAALERSGLPPSRLEIEVTERALISDGAAALDEMRAIRSLGVSLSLDDFGAGYSSLRYLSMFPFNGLKLDRGFVEELCVNARSRRIALHVLQLGHELGMTVCAEGVETERQRSILQQDGYDWIQGYHIGRPAALPRIVAGDASPAAAPFRLDPQPYVTPDPRVVGSDRG